MLGAMASLPFIDVFAKLLGAGGIPIVQIVFARMAFGTLAAYPFARRVVPLRHLFPQNPLAHALRAALLSAATFLFFSALKTMPIADALAIFFVQPIIVTALSGAVLGEKVGARGWTAVVIGFAGILVILRPGMGALNTGALLALAAGAALALYFLLSHRMAASAPAAVVTLQTNAIAALGLGLIVPAIWTPPSLSQWAMLAGVGIIASMGHFLILRAYDHAEASLLAPLAYTEMAMATLLGWLVFGQFPDGFTFLGVAILAVATLITAWPALRSFARRPNMPQ